MNMRIAIGEIKQESNTFAAGKTTLIDFAAFHLWYGDDLIANLRGTNSEISGFLAVLAEAGMTPVPTLAAFAISGGPVTSEAFATLRDELIRRLLAQPVDGILLALHGAMVVEDDPDPDGTLLAAVRAAVGSEMPLVATMDLHANVTRRCVGALDALVGFKTCPHVDQRETGARAAAILVRRLRGEVRPTVTLRKIPMITPASTHVDFQTGPFKRLQEMSRKLEERPGVLAASLFSVQPWLDIPEMGFAAVVVSDAAQTVGPDHAAGVVACELADAAWAERFAFMDAELIPVDEAIHRAMAAPTGPVVLSDLADGTGAGSPGDATAVLAALLAADPDRPALIWLFDPEAAAQASAVGASNAIRCAVGGKRDHLYNRPVAFSGVVERVEPMRYRFGGPGYTGMEMEMGLSAVLRHNQVYLLVTSNSVMTVDPALYRAAGLEPADAQIVVVKSHIQFRAGYAGLAAEMIMLDSPGMSSDHLAQFDWRHVDRPLFPLDPETGYRCAAHQEED